MIEGIQHPVNFCDFGFASGKVQILLLDLVGGHQQFFHSFAQIPAEQKGNHHKQAQDFQDYNCNQDQIRRREDMTQRLVGKLGG